MNKSETWGFLGTVLWGIFIIVILLGVGQLIPIYIFAFLVEPMVDITILRHYMAVMETNALLLSISAIGSTLFVVPFVFLIAKLKKGSNLKDYFSLNGFCRKTLLFWLLATFLMLIAEDAITTFSTIEEIPSFMMNITYPNNLSKVLLVLGVAFFAPILEEVIFRGFLLKGLSNSFLGVWGAIIISSFVWSSVHFQYELVYLVMIFVTGLVFGYAKVKTNSLFIPIIMHVLFNLVAMVELYLEKGIV
jgi:membrane protease YdiL (CAAX protease family)